MDRRLLRDDEVRDQLQSLPSWQLKEGKLYRELTFASFVEAFGFLASVALVAERMNHHPEIHNVYNWLSLTLWTHDQNGLTALDFSLARAAEQLV